MILKILEKSIKLITKQNNIPSFKIEICEEKFKAHYSTNILLKIKSILPLNFENQLINILKKNKYIENVEIINFFINLKMSDKYFFDNFKKVNNKIKLPNIGKKEKVNVEYCSLNPTGFMHIGHARSAIIGDCIANLLTKANYKVTKEYYVNNAGNQINLLAQSILKRYEQIKNPNIPFIENGYNGDEIKKIANSLKGNETFEEVKKIGVDFFIKNIKKDLKLINIKHKVWSYETEIINSGNIEKVIEIFKNKNLIYLDKRENKQNEKGNISNNNLMLLKTTMFGDDQDRPLTKEDGSWTYFAPDIGYHLNKIERGFTKLITTLGADHDSYAKRIKIAVNILNPTIKYDIITCQMVSYEDNGNLIKFSKRKGNVLRLSHFVKEISQDVLRFMMLDQTPGNFFKFDYETALSISLKNPIFYCHYAFSRASSLLKNINNEKTEISIDIFKKESIQNLLIQLFNIKNVIETSVNELKPSILTKYLIKISEKFHKLWQEEKIITENEILTQQKLQIIKYYIKISSVIFECIGIKPKEKM